MVAISRALNSGLLLSGQEVFLDVATPQQASVEQYNIINYLGGSAPYKQHPGFGIDTTIPRGCKLQQVHLISRHGERYPLSGDGKQFEAVYNKIKAYKHRFLGELEFLNDYEYFVSDPKYYEKETMPSNSQGPFQGTADELRHGEAFRQKYGELYDKAQKFLVFTTNSGRVHESSRYFARGFLGDDYVEEDVTYAILPDEDPEFGANSLTPRYGCTNYNENENRGKTLGYDRDYLQTALDRFKESNPSLDWTTDNVYYLFAWCAFELNVKGSSPFCKLFSNEELVRYAYSLDLDNYYGNGPGNSLSSTIGSPLVKAQLSLLKDDSSENKIWVSFTHDTDIEMFYAAIGLFDPERELPIDYIPFPNPYSQGQIVPQGARLYTEKYSCGSKSYVRFIANDAVIPLATCQNGPGFSCKLSDYEAYVSPRLTDFAERCNSQGRPEKVTFYWDYPTSDYNSPDVNQ